MRTHNTLFLTLIVLASSACASTEGKHQATSSISDIQPASPTVAAVQPDASVAPEPATPLFQNVTIATRSAPGVDGVAATKNRSQAELDAEAIYEQAPIRDPWEEFNRKIHGFNNAADKYVLRPLAVGYDKIMPDPVQAGVSRFFANLSLPATVVNQALQGRPGDAAWSLGRFVVNTTVGIGGVFDPSSRFGMPRRDDEDFGQTLATWGWQDSRYLVVPLLGPRTLRDTVAILGDQPLSPIGQIQDNGTANGLQLLEIVDGRTRMLPMDEIRRSALDDYLFVRDAWSQRRNHQVQQDPRSTRD